MSVPLPDKLQRQVFRVSLAEGFTIQRRRGTTSSHFCLVVRGAEMTDWLLHDELEEILCDAAATCSHEFIETQLK